MVELEKRIANLLRNITNSLTIKEMSKTDFDEYFHRELENNSLVPPVKNLDSSYLIGAISHFVSERLQISESRGIKHDKYVHLSNTPISESAMDDIMVYDKLFEKFRARIIPQIENKLITREEYNSRVKEIVEALLVEYEFDLPEKRRELLAIEYSVFCQFDHKSKINFKIINEKDELRYWGVTKSQIEQMIANVDF